MNKHMMAGKRSVQKTIASKLSELASLQPDAVFAKNSVSELSYAEAHTTSELVFTWIQQQPFFEVGQPLFTMCEAKPAYLPLILGALNSGMIWVGLDPGSPVGHNKRILEFTDKPIVITPDEYIQAAQKFGISEQIFSFEQITIDDVVVKIYQPDFDSKALIVFTSGSTSKPKGVVRSQRDLYDNASAQARTYEFTSHDCVAAGYATNTMGFLRAFLNILCAGGCYRPIQLTSTGDDSLVSVLMDSTVNNLHMVAPVFRKLFASINIDNRFHNIERVILGGDAATPVDLDLFRRYFQESCGIFSSLGSSEAGTISIWRGSHEYTPEREKLPCGQTLASVKTLLRVDGKISKPAENEIGELLVSSPNLAKEYWNNAALSDEKWLEMDDGERFYCTGDLVAFDEMGLLHHFGRTDTSAKINGVLIDPSAIEFALMQYPHLEDVAVVIDAESFNGKPVVEAFLVITSEFDRLEFEKFVETNLVDAARPRVLYEMDRPPRTQSGKLTITSLDRTRPFSTSLKNSAKSVPNSEGLKEIWSKILELDEIPDEGNFVSLGGDSLDFIALVLNIEQKFGVRFSVDELAAALTLPAMTLAITEKSKGRQRSFESDTRSLIADTLSTWEGESIGDNELVKRISSSQNSVLYWCLQSEREFKRLSQLLEKTVNLHGLRSLNLLIKRTDENLAEVAELYADEIISLHRDHNTPLYIGGNCQGSTLMLWVAKALERKGMEINHFIMMEKFFDEPLAFPVTMLFGDKSERNLFRFGGLTLPYAKSRYPNLRGIYEVRGQHAQFFSDNNIDSLAVQIINAIRDAEKRTLRNRNFLRVNLKNLRVRTFATLAKKFH